MMIIHTAPQKSFDFLEGKLVVVEVTDAQLTSDAGLLPIRQFDERIGLTAGFIAALEDPRHPSYVDHSFAEMTRMRLYGILADYADQNDHDVLRHDPVFKMLANRSPDEPALASQPTLSRFENQIGIASFYRLRDEFLDQFLASFAKPPRHLTFDIDTFDDPTHGQQQLTFFHGYYEQYQYLPRAITCAENDAVVMICLLHGTAHAALGAEDDLEYLAARLRQAWPDVQIHIRGDSAFGVPKMFTVCERLRLDFSFGVRMNAVLKAESDALLKQAVEQFEQTGTPQRQFTAFEYQAGSWPQPRWTIVKCEAHEQGTNRRAVVTNRPGARVLPGAAYEAFADRGESENRNKELKDGLQADRLSDHRYLANLFRLYLHAAACNLMVRLRRAAGDPPLENSTEAIPAEALAGQKRREYHNQRRERDPLGEGQPCTWRTRLIKVAAQIHVTTRRIVVRLSHSWPYLAHYFRIADVALALPVPPRESG
jgi:Transposase DDE domain group 1